MALSIHDFSQKGKSTNDSLLKNEGLNLNEIESNKETFLDWKIFVLTGSLVNSTRDNAALEIESLGGKVSSGVSKNNNFWWLSRCRFKS